MLESFLTFIGEHELLGPDDKILLTVSGGIDSMVMSDLFLRAGYEFSIAHCNFQLRGEESDADEALVKEMAKNRGISLFTERFETERFASDRGISIQMAARQLRNEWFEALLERHGFDIYAVAHHLDDSFETFLFNITKGTGIAGMHGIRPKSGHVIRPLLFATRAMIEKYARERSLIWREDASNTSLKYHRNKIRHMVVPVLREINPDLEKTFLSTVERISAVEDIFLSQIRNVRERAVMRKDSGLWIRMEAVMKSPGSPAVLHELIRRFGFNYRQAANIVRHWPGRSGRLFYSPTHIMVADREYLIISARETEKEEMVKIEKGTREVSLRQVTLTFQVLPAEEVSFNTGEETAILDYDKLLFPLLVRNRKRGDFFRPLGMRGKKKLSDFMIDEKIPVNLKKDVMVLQSGDDIAWVINYRIDDRFKVTESTRHVLKIIAKSHV